ncbi:MAG TPA: outer membrane protein [Pseudolabrys sp.]
MKANLLKLSLIAAASFVVSNALAADLPRPVYKAPAYVADPIFSWTGFYIGANAGYGFGKSDWDFPAGTSTSPKGFVGGAQLGYNYQIGSFVFGLEGDYDYSAMKGDTACGGTTCTTKNTWLATGRGRIGYAFDRFLPYFTGGVAFGNVKAETPFAGSSSNRTGYALGGGLEYALLGAWSVRAEYLYVDLGSFNAAVAPLTNNVSFKANVVRAGINYRF